MSVDGELSPLPSVAAPPESRLANKTTLLLATLFILVGAMLLFTQGIAPHLLGYLFASLLPFTLVALFRRFSLRRLAGSGIAPNRWTRPACTVIILCGFAVAILHAWAIAVEIA